MTVLLHEIDSGLTPEKALGTVLEFADEDPTDVLDSLAEETRAALAAVRAHPEAFPEGSERALTSLQVCILRRKVITSEGKRSSQEH